jgi:hypothetical protein
MKTMRNTSIKLYTYLIILSAFFVSCQKDFLDTKIDTSLTDINLDSDYRVMFRFANAPYPYLNYVASGYEAIDNNLFAACSDEAVQTSTGFNESTIFTKGLMTPYNNPDNVYNLCYEGIRAANYFIENFQDYKVRLAQNRDTISDKGIQYNLDVKDMGYYMAEAHVLRAYYYYELIKRYGAVPLVKNTLSIDDNTNIARSDFSEIVDFIISEIDTELPNLNPDWINSVKNPLYTKTADQNKAGRLDKASALSIKQRVLLLSASPLHNPTNDVEKWKKAAEAGNQLIAMNQFSLDAKYDALFTSDNTVKSKETIWAIRLGTTNNLEKSNYPIMTKGGHNEITPTQNLVNAYEFIGAEDPSNPYANRDPRLNLTIATNGSTWTGRPIQIWDGGTDSYKKSNVSRTGYYLRKFLNDKLDLIKNDAKQRSWIVFRYGETLLSYAEAMNEAYGPDNNNGYSLTAREAINIVRSRAGVAMPAVVAANQSEMRDKIKHERRIELAFEGYRYWDLIRWKDAENALNTPITGVVATMNSDSITVTYATIEVEKRVFNASKMYLYPIPQAEIAKSDGVILQNSGW